MSKALDDPERLRALARTGAMDTDANDAFDRLTRISARLLGAPVALVSLVDGQRQFFKSEVGLGMRETPLSHSFCQHVVLTEQPMIITDSRMDPRVAGNLAITELDVIAYAGVPLTDRDGNTLGSFCVIEHEPREWADSDIALLRDLARGVVTELELGALNRLLIASEEQTRAVIDGSQDAFVSVSLNGTIGDWNPAAEELFGWPARDAIGRRSIDLLNLTALHDSNRDTALNAVTGLPSAADDAVLLNAKARSGETLTVEARIAQARSPNGVVVNAFMRDVSALVLAQAARQSAEEELRVTVEHAPIGVALVELTNGAHGRLLRTNTAFRRLIGLSEADASPATLASVTHPDDVERLDGELRLLAEGTLPRTEIEVRWLHEDGRIIWLSFTAARVTGVDGGGASRAVVHALDIGERKRFEGQLQYQADHDALTGLFNRRRFEEELDRAIARVSRYPGRCSVLLIDLDGFKDVNDSMGHSVGDELLARIGAAIREALRDTDVIARLGGDEFAVIVTNATADEAMLVAEKLLAAVHTGALSANRNAHVSASIGVTTFDGESKPTVREVLVEADVAMYQAKDSGKNIAAAYVSHPDHLAGAEDRS